MLYSNNVLRLFSYEPGFIDYHAGSVLLPVPKVNLWGMRIIVAYLCRGQFTTSGLNEVSAQKIRLYNN